MQKSQGAAPACLYRQEHTRFFPQHTHTACRASGGCCCGGMRCRVGPLLGRGSLFLFHGLCFPLMMGPLSVLPVDLHHSGLLIKPPFTKPKQGNKEGKREKGEKGSDGSVERQRRWEGETQREAERVKGRKERVCDGRGCSGRLSKTGEIFRSWTEKPSELEKKEQKNNWIGVDGKNERFPSLPSPAPHLLI